MIIRRAAVEDSEHMLATEQLGEITVYSMLRCTGGYLMSYQEDDPTHTADVLNN